MTIISGTISSPNTPQALSSTSRNFQFATFYAFKSLAVNGTGINNTSGVWVGPASGLSLNYLVPGDMFSYNLPYGLKEDVANFYMVGAVGDGVVGILYP